MSSDSVRYSENEKSVPIDRTKVRLIQTPQVFKSEILQSSYQAEYNQKFTDDANVVEFAGNKIFLSEGNIENIKITTPFDLMIADTIFNYIKTTGYEKF
jgi:2-C-methyl-D-erythritol 4-phosphate cytidylyltransferase